LLFDTGAPYISTIIDSRVEPSWNGSVPVYGQMEFAKFDAICSRHCAKSWNYATAWTALVRPYKDEMNLISNQVLMFAHLPRVKVAAIDVFPLPTSEMFLVCPFLKMDSCTSAMHRFRP
jgi:hypothetical protein